MQVQIREDKELEWFRLPKNEWSKPYWAVIDIFTSHYRPDQMTDKAKLAFTETALNMRYLLPCPKCRAHFEDHVRDYPIDHYLNDPDGLIKWFKIIKDKTQGHKHQKLENPDENVQNSQILQNNEIGETNSDITNSPKATIRTRRNMRIIDRNLNVPQVQAPENKVSFVQKIPEQHKKRGKFVKVPQVTEEIIGSVVEGLDGKKILIKRNRIKEMTFKEYIQYRIETTPHVSACNCG